MMKKLEIPAQKLNPNEFKFLGAENVFFLFFFFPQFNFIYFDVWRVCIRLKPKLLPLTI